MDDNYPDSYINNNIKVKVLDVNNSFIKIEYQKGKQIINKLLDIDIITSIREVEEVK